MDQRKLTVLEATDVALQRGLKAGLEKGLQVALKYMYKQAFAEGLKVGLLAGAKPVVGRRKRGLQEGRRQKFLLKGWCRSIARSASWSSRRTSSGITGRGRTGLRITARSAAGRFSAVGLDGIQRRLRSRSGSVGSF